jgi:hypothetical protein
LYPYLMLKFSPKSAQAQSMILQVHTTITIDLFWAIY